MAVPASGNSISMRGIFSLKRMKMTMAQKIWTEKAILV